MTCGSCSHKIKERDIAGVCSYCEWHICNICGLFEEEEGLYKCPKCIERKRKKNWFEEWADVIKSIKFRR